MELVKSLVWIDSVALKITFRPPVSGGAFWLSDGASGDMPEASGIEVAASVGAGVAAGALADRPPGAALLLAHPAKSASARAAAANTAILLRMVSSPFFVFNFLRR